jgi:diguanylate cyclase (GGDEF)-like protein
MLLPQTKEREYRFKLALRMGLPIFALILAFISHTLISNYENLQSAFYIEAVLLVLVGIYFIFYLIYNGFKVKITDGITNTFTREYLYEYLKKEISVKKEYTLVLISIENLSDINNLYGLKNGDKVLQEVAQWIASTLEKDGIENFPIGHIKGGDFILGLDGPKERYSVIIDMLHLKANDLKVGNIEVKISTALTDTSYSQELDYLVEHLFELQEKNRELKNTPKEENINPNELEASVMQAIQKKNIDAMAQSVFHSHTEAFRECFIRLRGTNGKLIFPKTYIKVINKLGLGVAFDSMVLEHILKHMDANNEEMCAVNILPTSLRNEQFIAKVKELPLQEGKKLLFVLNESQYYAFTSRYKQIMESLKQDGILFAIDRLGTLHTSFLYLRELPVDVVRFDTYYSKKEKLQEHYSVLEGFVVMAHNKGVKTWMKNIEDEESYLLAKKLNIDYIQGKYLSQLEKQE